MVITMAKMMMNEKSIYEFAVAFDYDIMMEFKAAVSIYARNGCKNVRINCPKIGYNRNGVTADEYYGLDYSDYDILRDVFGGYLDVMLIESLPAYYDRIDGRSYYLVRGF